MLQLEMELKLKLENFRSDLRKQVTKIWQLKAELTKEKDLLQKQKNALLQSSRSQYTLYDLDLEEQEKRIAFEIDVVEKRIKLARQELQEAASTFQEGESEEGKVINSSVISSIGNNGDCNMENKTLNLSLNTKDTRKEDEKEKAQLHAAKQQQMAEMKEIKETLVQILGNLQKLIAPAANKLNVSTNPQAASNAVPSKNYFLKQVKFKTLQINCKTWC